MASAGVLRGRPRGRGVRRRWVRSSSARVNSAGPSGRPLCVQRRIDPALGVRGQKELPPVAAMRHMMRHVRNHHSSDAWHRQRLSAARPSANGPAALPPLRHGSSTPGQVEGQAEKVKRVNI